MGQLLLSEVLMRATLLCGGAGDQRRPRRLSLCAHGEVASPSGPQPSRRRGGRGGTEAATAPATALASGAGPTQPREGLGLAAPGFPAKLSPAGCGLVASKGLEKSVL